MAGYRCFKQTFGRASASQRKELPSTKDLEARCECRQVDFRVTEVRGNEKKTRST